MNPRCNETPPPLVIEAIEHFNAGEFYEAHEILEEAWNEESQSIRRLYQGILQIDVGFYHLMNLNYNGAISMLLTGAYTLHEFAPSCQGIEVAGLIDAALDYRVWLVARGRTNIAEYVQRAFPKIVYVE